MSMAGKRYYGSDVPRSAGPHPDPMSDPDARIYPCADCGKMRSKNEGGTTFTVCDDCWDRSYANYK